jgi:hypothetical protein
VPGPSFDFSYECTAGLARVILRREFSRRLPRPLLSVAVLVALASAPISQSESSWLNGWICGILVGWVILWLVLLVKLYQSSRSVLEAYVGHRISIHLDAHGLRISSPVHTSESPWWAIASVRESAQALFLVRKGVQGATVLPHEALSADAVAFIKTSIGAATRPSNGST